MEPQREWFEKDYYAMLGVSASASDRDIKKAYKELARKFHPDQNPDNHAAEERFKEVSSAYDVLGDAEKRKAYDEVRRMVAAGGVPGGGGFGPGPGGPGSMRFDFSDFAEADGGAGLGDLFGNLFGQARPGGGRSRRPRGGPQRGRDLETELFLDFDDSVRGVTTTVRFTSDAVCSTCNGNGAAPGTAPQQCGQCQGTGNATIDQGPFSFSQVCRTCNGSGSIIVDPCATCSGRGVEVRGREVKVRIPAGVTDGQRIRVKERGAAGLHGGPPGDLYVIVHVAAHQQFGRQGDDLTVRRTIPWSTAVLGGTLDVPTLNGSRVTIRIPSGTPSGKVLRVPGKGVGDKGAMLVTVDVEIPTDLTEAQRRAVEAVAVAFGEPIRRPDSRADSAKADAERKRTFDGAA